MLALIWYGLCTVMIIPAIFIAVRLRYAFTHFTIKNFVSEPSMLRDMPSVSVCIPARNEMHAMTECLERVIASTYPKLEIIVLDDGSADNTSVLIKSFAHAGVRFVEGSKLPDGWLGKNHALQGLLDEASGHYILFMDVDTRIKPDTIEQLVSYAKQENATMLSVLPRREDGWRASIVFATLRYYWELILHKASKPAVASSAWMIGRHALRDELGGFEPIKTAIQPEAVLARELTVNDAYRFLMSSSMLGLAYEKKWQSQVETSVRLLYPVLGGSILSSIVATLVMTILALPFFVLLSGFIVGWSMVQLCALLELCVFASLYASYLRRVWLRMWWLGALLWPVILIQEIVVLAMSTWRHLRGNVTWKGRPVTTKQTTS
jgi:chlorobactene glucosyltransferase